MVQQKRVPDCDGFSVYELYFMFTRQTGWTVPINITGFSQQSRPVKLRSRTARVCWAHESDWQELSLSRQPLNKQCKVFLHNIPKARTPLFRGKFPRAIFMYEACGVQ